MDVQKELGKWKSEYVKCNTPEELADHKKRFRAFLQTLSPEDKKAFADKLMKQYQAQTTNVDVSKLTDTRQSLEKRRSKFKEMFAADIITMDELKKEMSAIDEGMRSIDEELKVYDEIQEKATHIDDIHKDIEQILMQNEYTNDDMRRIIEKIVVYPDKSVEIFMK